MCVFRIRIKSHLTAAAREHNGNQYNSAACVVENQRQLAAVRLLSFPACEFLFTPQRH
jgi:hypothetical protein